VDPRFQSLLLPGNKKYRYGLFEDVCALAISLCAGPAFWRDRQRAKSRAGGHLQGSVWNLDCGLSRAQYRHPPPPEAQQEQTAAKPRSVIGTVLDQTASVAAGVVVHVISEDKSYSQEVVTGDNGQFSFSNVPPGRFSFRSARRGLAIKNSRENSRLDRPAWCRRL